MDTATAVRQLFDGFSRVWGHQAMARQWPAETLPNVIETWTRQLRSYPVKTIHRAAQSVIDNGGAFPPSLAEFKDVCRQYRQQTEYQALPPPRVDTSAAQAAIKRAKALAGTYSIADDELYNAPIADGIIGKIQREYRAGIEKKRQGKPNKAWAAKMLLSWAGGESLRPQQFPMAVNGLGLTADEVAELQGVRGG